MQRLGFKTVLLACVCHAALAQVPQTPPEVPPPSDLAPRPTPPPPDAARLPQAPPPPRELGKPEDDLKVDVTAYAVDPDAPAALREALARLTAPFVGPERSYEDLVNAAGEVTRFLQSDLGYYLGYAYLPEQAPQDGVIRIAILEGRLDRVVLNWPDDGMLVDKDVVEAYLARLKPGEILKVDDIERTVFLLNDLRGLNVRAEVTAGSKPGTATMVFSARPDPRWSGKIDADANGSRFIGAYRLGALIGVNSPLGRGDGLSATVLASTSGGLQFGLLGYNVPLGSDGFKAGLSVSTLRYQLDEDEFPIDIHGDGLTLNAYGLYPWVRSRNLNLFVVGAVDSKSYTDSQAGIESDKRIDDASIGLTGDFRDTWFSGAVNTFELNLATGRLHFPDGAPSGLDDARSYTKFTLSYSRLQNLISGWWLGYFAMRGQWAFDNLDTTEQFRAGGPDGVRAYAPGEGTGDSGIVVTTELRLLPPESWLGRYARETVFALFADAAYVRPRQDPSQGIRRDDEPNHLGLAGVGLSVAWSRPGEYAARLSLAHPVRGVAKGDTKKQDPRIYFQLSRLF